MGRVCEMRWEGCVGWGGEGVWGGVGRVCGVGWGGCVR